MDKFKLAEKQLIRRYNRNTVVSCRMVTIRKELELYRNIHKINLDTYATAISTKSSLILN